jgi:hypothetical protein
LCGCNHSSVCSHGPPGPTLSETQRRTTLCTPHCFSKPSMSRAHNATILLIGLRSIRSCSLFLRYRAMLSSVALFLWHAQIVVEGFQAHRRGSCQWQAYNNRQCPALTLSRPLLQRPGGTHHLYVNLIETTLGASSLSGSISLGVMSTLQQRYT